MKRFFILSGDLTTVGGKVLGGSGSITWHGRPTAWEGDIVECPKCNELGAIHCVGARIPSRNPQGQLQALNGDICVCGCTPPPRLISSQTMFNTEGEWHEEDYSYDSTMTRDSSSKHDIYFLVRDGKGSPLGSTGYRISLASGEIVEGITSVDGYTQRINSDSAQIATIEIPYYGNVNAQTYSDGKSGACTC